MGEFVWKYVSWRLFALSEEEIAPLTTAMRQLGVGPRGGVEALAIFHQLIYDDWASESLNTLAPGHCGVLCSIFCFQAILG